MFFFHLHFKSKDKTSSIVCNIVICSWFFWKMPFLLKGEFAVVRTDKICGRSISSNIPVDMKMPFSNVEQTKVSDEK